MSLLSRLFSRSSAALPAPRAAVQSDGPGRLITSAADLEEFLRTSGALTGAGVAVTPEKALSVSTVFACVRLIAGAIATMPLNIKRRVDARTRETADDHAVAKLFKRRPNRWMTASAFRRMLTTHILLRGNAYALKVKGLRGYVELIPMHPDQVEVKQLPDLSLVYIYTRKNGSTITLPQAEVMHLIGFTLDGVRGVSVISYMRETIGLALATEAHGAAVFRNGASIGLHFEHPAQLGDEALEHIKASLADFRGSENAFKTLITEEGVKLNQLGMNQEDAQYIETRKLTRSEIAMFFGVPPHMIGDTEKSTSWGSGIEQQSIGFVAYTLEDWLTTWEETIDRDLLADEPALFARFNRAGLVRGDIKTRYGAYAIGRQWGWLSANDIRALEDENPIAGGDTYLQPMNMNPAGATLQADEQDKGQQP